MALSAILLLGVCIALMGVSFTLTSKIDEMGEYNTSIPNSYSDILKPRLTSSITIILYIIGIINAS